LFFFYKKNQKNRPLLKAPLQSGLAAHLLSQRRWRVATRHALIDGDAIVVLGKVKEAQFLTGAFMSVSSA
jgi:hypothetical protein